MLGQTLTKVLIENRYEVFGVSKTSRLSLPGLYEINADLCDSNLVEKILKHSKPDIIIHTAAFTNLEYCERNISECYTMHVELTQKLAEYASAKMIYISTDSVFKGDLGGYAEDDPTYPLNYYAHSKLEGEWSMLRTNHLSTVIRTNIYGFKRPPGNSLVEWALSSLREKQDVKGFTDVIFNPLYVGQLSQIIIKLLSSKISGLLHVGASENISKFTFLRKLASTFGYPEDFVSASLSSDNNEIRRPKNTALNIQRMKKLFNEVPLLSTGFDMLKTDYLNFYGID